MSICPECQFENPDANKFCERCGTSLTQRPCPACGAQVAVSELNCTACGSQVAPLLRLTLFVPPDVDPWPSEGESYQRYGLAGDLTPDPIAPREYTGRAYDRQPYQLRLLDRLANNPDLDSDHLADAIPTLAQPYLLIESPLAQRLPQLHEAWQDDQGRQGLLLDDRSQWRSLVDLWSAPDTPPLQVVHHLGEMLDLYDALQPLDSELSLLVLENLRVDEDRVLCLDRLYNGGSVVGLEGLGKLWQSAIDAAGRPDLPDPVRLLANDLANNRLPNLEAARQALQHLSENWDRLTSEHQDPPPAGTAIAPEGVSLDQLLGSGATADEDDDDAPTVVLPMRLAALDEAGRTDIGRQRDHNEDCFGLYTEVRRRETPTGKYIQAHNLYVLCDGMGGHASGEVASNLAVKTLHEYFANVAIDRLPTANEIRDGILAANQAIFEANQQDLRSGSGRMGTTLVLATVHDSKVAIAHVGDSRIYRLSRRRGLEQITVDHEVGQREIQRGIDPEAAYARPDAYQLTQALGPRDSEHIEPDVQFFDLDEDTLLLLCSDGLSDNDLIETHWQTHLAPLLSSRANLDQGVSQLVDLANQHNGHDNITALLVRAKVQPNMDLMRG